MSEVKQIILFGAGVAGQIALCYYGNERVYCFADNNKHGQEICGKRVISFDELLQIHSLYVVLIAASFEVCQSIKNQCADNGITAEAYDKTITHLDYESNPEIAKYRDIHAGKRCFLVGNGPSLRPDDLDKICRSGDVSFGCNLIYKIFPETKWRPDYFSVCDISLLQTYYQNFSSVDANCKFINSPFQFDCKNRTEIIDCFLRGRGETCFYSKSTPASNIESRFSPDPSRLVYNFQTVMYVMLQIAVYMGFDRIYTIGVDNTGGHTADSIREIFSDVNHFYSEKDADAAASQFLSFRDGFVDIKLSARCADTGYVVAKNSCQNRGVNIFNATRGGMLETFERVDFDSLF
ncbi:MAG: hypothetical protein LBS90_00460 [Oscillospiraceae bacterium]|jgi:hypothetical protein|nr:hypothetical protein [Oscillospiraceae bacterium]